MKNIFLFFTILSFCVLASCKTQDKTIKPDDAKNYIGKVITVTGVVESVYHAEKAIYLNMGGKYPDNTFTAVIFIADADKFKDIDSYEGKTVEITGTVKEYKDKPQIILNKAEQIKVK